MIQRMWKPVRAVVDRLGSVARATSRSLGATPLPVWVVLGLVAGLFVLYELPDWLVREAVGRHPKLTDEKRVSAITEERRTILAAFAAAGAGITLWYTHQRQKLDRDSNRTDRYTRAVEQLGDDSKPAVQLGGVYALERVAQDSPRDHDVAFAVLSAFIRQQSAAQASTRTKPADGSPGWRGSLGEPVKAAIAVVQRNPRPRLQLQGLRAAGADLTRADLTRADLTDADLTRADLAGADLAAARLNGANLGGAVLGGAVLPGANLTAAVLTVADFDGADLTGADLRGANLSGANLSGARLVGADLARADLTRARLARADLTGADLTDADLTIANLTDARLNGADLTGADLTSARLTGADLTRARLTDVLGFPPSPPS